jgi:asparagine synthase (glutamine-hydrolysing)
MCGICGLFDLEGHPVERELLERMRGAITHRGPDGAGELFDGPVALGHRRLSIIDVSGGAQPIGNESGSLQVVFNGEIYNFIELREELKGYGHQFRTRSDTEVIVHAYEQWGTECVTRFNGMFAFALWDSQARQLFLARDHLGIKPLYYARHGTKLLFASEVKSILQDPRVARAVDTDALAELFTYRFVPSPKTLFQGILKLAPGHWMLCSREGVRIHRYWTAVPRSRRATPERQLIEEYQALVEDAVRLQMRSDVPVGLFLSSGVDSGALLAIMQQYSSAPVETFTIGFRDGEATNELDDASATARHFGAEHHSVILSAQDYVAYFERYLSDLEEPVGHEAAPAFYFLSRATAGRVKVALTGQGVDEPWAGYDRYKGVQLSALYSRLPALLTSRLLPLAARLAGNAERFRRGVASLSEPDVLTRFAKIYSFFEPEMKAELYRGVLRRDLVRDPFGTRAAIRPLYADVEDLDPLTQMLYIDTRASLPDDLLMVADKTSMANSLEVRVPFLDRRIVEFVESLPADLKLRRLSGKYLHKKAMRRWLPQSMVYRKKKGFTLPMAHWLRTSMWSFVEDALLGRDSFVGDCFERREVRRILESHSQRRQGYARHIYLLLSVELWHRAFMRAGTPGGYERMPLRVSA